MLESIDTRERLPSIGQWVDTTICKTERTGGSTMRSIEDQRSRVALCNRAIIAWRAYVPKPLRVGRTFHVDINLPGNSSVRLSVPRFNGPQWRPLVTTAVNSYDIVCNICVIVERTAPLHLDDYLRLICFLSTTAYSALGVSAIMRYINRPFTYLLT